MKAALLSALLFSGVYHASAQINPVKDSAAKPSPELTDDRIVFTRAETMPQFPGGVPAWDQFVRDSLQYPSKARRKKIEGRVLVQFIVEKDGHLQQVALIAGDPLLADAAVGLLQKSSKWIPATQNHYIVRCYQKQAVDFQLPGK